MVAYSLPVTTGLSQSILRVRSQMNRTTRFRIPNMLRATLIALLVAVTTAHNSGTQTAIKSHNSERSDNSPTPVLDVINRHFTIGEKIPSVYLRVLSDRTAECHTLAFSGHEPNVVKKKTLAPEEFKRLTELLNDPGLLSVKSRYESNGTIVDSWMEWDIKIQHADSSQKLEVVNFSPSWLGLAQPYPDPLLRLGCAVWKIRDDVFGDEPGHRDAKCEKALRRPGPD